MTPYVDDTDFTLYVGDVLEVLAGLPAESVHCCVTSPPYWGLRDYGTSAWEGGDAECDHAPTERKGGASVRDSARPGPEDVRQLREGTGPVPDRRGSLSEASLPEVHTGERGARGLAVSGRSALCHCGARLLDAQLGNESTPEEYVAGMVVVFREVRRILRRDGTLWLNIGDSYARGRSGRDDNGVSNQGREAGWKQHPEIGSNDRGLAAGLKPKDLVGIPWRLAFALQADGWYLRSDVIWSKPNPMPESVTDRPTKAHEYLFLLTRSPRYFYDADAIRESAEYGRRDWSNVNGNMASVGGGRGSATVSGGDPTAGRNKRSVWEIATEPYPDAHFATFPQALVEPCVLAGTSERGCCPVCGAPWERETERTPMVVRPTPKREAWQSEDDHARTQVGGTVLAAATFTTTGGRPTCGTDGHPCFAAHAPATAWVAPVPCTVLDPFMGSGTTALVARRHGRKSIGIELNAEYAKLAATRLQQLSLLAGAV